MTYQDALLILRVAPFSTLFTPCVPPRMRLGLQVPQTWFMLGGRSDKLRLGYPRHKVSLPDRATCLSHRPYLPYPRPPTGLLSNQRGWGGAAGLRGSS